MNSASSPRRATRATEPPAADVSEGQHWSTRRERSNMLTVRFMAWVAVTLGRPLARLLLHPITLYFLCFAPAARRHSKRFLARAMGRPPTLAERYRHLHHFSATVLDRIYFVRGQVQDFDIRMEGGELVTDNLAEGRGALLLGAHIGSFEALHAIGINQPHSLRVAMAMFPDNAQMIHRVLQAVAPGFQLGIIPIGRSGSTLTIRDWLDGGGVVGLLGDRFIETDSVRGNSNIELPFLGQVTRFSDGPLRLALLLRRRVIFMVGLYRGGKRYEVRFKVLADFTHPPTGAAEREACVRVALEAYVAQLEALAREVPENWFNFYDYWCEDASRP